MFKNDIPEVRPLELITAVKLCFKKYFVITHYISGKDHYDTVIKPKKLIGNDISLKKSRFDNFCYRAVSERQARRNHIKVADAFNKGKKAVYKLGDGNLKH